MLEVRNVSGGYGDVPVIENIDFKAAPGEIIGMIGPNGSGKSTLLKLLYKGLRPDSGSIHLDNADMESLSQKYIARQLAVLPQQMEHTFSYSVREVVELGRYPHQKGWFSRFTKADTEMIEQAMIETNILSYADRTLESLSGGEKQRVFLARALAQEPKILLLDEPTNHLDISFQVQLLDTLKKWTREKKMTVIAALHDLNLAALYSDRLLLLDKGEQAALDKPGRILEKERLQNVYGVHLFPREHPTVPSLQISLEPESYPKEHSFRHPAEQLQREQNEDCTSLASPFYWKTFSSTNPGLGWHRCFILGRSLNKGETDISDRDALLLQNGFDGTETAVMITEAKRWKEGFSRSFHPADVFVYTVAACSSSNDSEIQRMTVHAWIFINRRVQEASYAKILMTAVEAKACAFVDMQVNGRALHLSGTEDEMLIAASQQGSGLQELNTFAALNKRVAEAVYEAVCDALK